MPVADKPSVVTDQYDLWRVKVETSKALVGKKLDMSTVNIRTYFNPSYSVNQLKKFIVFNNYVNIQARSLVAALSYNN